MNNEGRRSIVIKDDDLWLKCIIKAKKMGKSISLVIRELLSKWLKEK
jgi:hypothetical protein